MLSFLAQRDHEAEAQLRRRQSQGGADENIEVDEASNPNESESADVWEQPRGRSNSRERGPSASSSPLAAPAEASHNSLDVLEVIDEDLGRPRASSIQNQKATTDRSQFASRKVNISFSPTSNSTDVLAEKVGSFAKNLHNRALTLTNASQSTSVTSTTSSPSASPVEAPAPEDDFEISGNPTHPVVNGLPIIPFSDPPHPFVRLVIDFIRLLARCESVLTELSKVSGSAPSIPHWYAFNIKLLRHQATDLFPILETLQTSNITSRRGRSDLAQILLGDAKIASASSIPSLSDLYNRFDLLNLKFDSLAQLTEHRELTRSQFSPSNLIFNQLRQPPPSSSFPSVSAEVELESTPLAAVIATKSDNAPTTHNPDPLRVLKAKLFELNQAQAAKQQAEMTQSQQNSLISDFDKITSTMLGSTHEITGALAAESPALSQLSLGVSQNLDDTKRLNQTLESVSGDLKGSRGLRMLSFAFTPVDLALQMIGLPSLGNLFSGDLCCLILGVILLWVVFAFMVVFIYTVKKPIVA